MSGIAVSNDVGTTFTVLTATENRLSGIYLNIISANSTSIYAIAGSSFLQSSTDRGATQGRQ
ncbi:MAG: hypothetical protein PVH04_12415 [Gammaproteobacteria bacterium]|jgi:hypothetical protein